MAGSTNLPSLDSLPLAIFSADLAGRFSYLNEACASLLGAGVDECVGRPIAERLHAEDRERFALEWAHAANATKVFRGSFRILTNGTWAWIAFRATPIEVDGGTSYSAVLTELSPRSIEAGAIVAQSIVHELANALTVVTGQIDFARESPGVPAELNDPHFVVALERASRLAHELQDFDQIPHRSAINSVEFVSRAAELLASALPSQVRIDVQQDAEPYALQVDASLLWRAIACVVLDARDDMPQGGQVVLSTSRVELAERGPFLRISIRHAGLGLDPLSLDDILHPRGVGRAALGPVLLDACATQHGGVFSVERAAGVGVTLHLSLPVSE